MPKPYSVDLRARVIEAVETGASRRAAADHYGISPSVVIIWAQRFEATGSVAPKRSGGSISPLEAHAQLLLGLTGDKSDLTLDEIGGDAQTQNSRQPQRGMAVLHSAL